MSRPAISIVCLAVCCAALAFGPAASAQLPKACTLLTNAEVAKALNDTIELVQSDSIAHLPGCSWQGKSLGGPLPGGPELGLGISQVSKAQFVAGVVQRTMTKNTGPYQRQVSVRVYGIGTLAFAVSGELSVWRHGVELDLFDAGSLQTQITLAKAALARL